MSKKRFNYNVDEDVEDSFSRKVAKESAKRKKGVKEYSKSNRVEKLQELYIKNGEKLFKDEK